MREQKKQSHMKMQDKVEMEKMRRWKIKIYNIYITPLQEILDPFLQFTVGGDFSVSVISSKSGGTVKLPQGERGWTNKTEVIINVPHLAKTAFDSIFVFEMRLSYAMISNQKLMIELWDYNKIWMNKLLSYQTLELSEIVSGDVNIKFELNSMEGGKKSNSNLIN